MFLLMSILSTCNMHDGHKHCDEMIAIVRFGRNGRAQIMLELDFISLVLNPFLGTQNEIFDIVYDVLDRNSSEKGVADFDRTYHL